MGCIVVLKMTFLYLFVLGDGLGAFRDWVFSSQLSGEKEPDDGLEIPGGDGESFVVVGQFGIHGNNTLKDIFEKVVHDAHSFQW